MKLTKIRRVIFNMFGLLAMRRSDYLLVSFPRSGNTWMRFLLCNLISLQEWNGQLVDFHLLNKTMPELGLNNLLTPWPHSTIPRVIKSHKSYSPLISLPQSIGIIRDPRDVMVSYYYYKKKRKGVYDGTFTEFIRHPKFGLESWFKHYLSWRDHWLLTLKYEEMKKEPFREFSRVLNILGVDYAEDIVQEAISRASIKNVKVVDTLVTTRNQQAKFIRDGRSSQWLDYFSQQDLAYYDELVAKYQVALYAQMKE